MNTGDILCELYEPSTSKEFRAEVFDFTLQLLQNPLSFTSCGFFDLDYTLIRNEIRRLTIQIETCTRSMDKLNIPMNLSKSFRQQCFIVLFVIVNIIAMFIIDFPLLNLSVKSYWKLCICFYLERYPCIVLLVNDLTYVFWMSMLTTSIDSPQHKKVLRINNKSNNNNDLVSSGIYRTYKSNEEVVKMKKIREIHLELIKCARNANDAYGIHILMSISTAFFLITIVAYNLYYHTTSGKYRSNAYEVISTVTTYLVILIQVGNVPEPFYPNSTLSTIDF
ncbi:uncharacterized protein LOC122514623 [Polistes fuscatus]|uniref:uncharacterized protein LOC122514623 n=1 Tax=Polistes fuscatus TaxID=30207 RepID=UPI001CA9769D|nr:uncharacterized protein LOC122514623 [Polistes fuscatus]